MSIYKQPTPSRARQCLVVLGVTAGALLLVYVVVLLAVPPKAFRDNVILRLIYEKHTQAVHWFQKK